MKMVLHPDDWKNISKLLTMVQMVHGATMPMDEKMSIECFRLEYRDAEYHPKELDYPPGHK